MVDISREYDFTSDFPNRPLSPFYLLPIANAAAGLVTVHLDYEGVNVDDPANVVWQDGNTTYVLVPTPTLSLLAPLQILGINPIALNAVLKPLVDSAYDRTYGGRVTPQPTTAAATPSPQSFAVERAVRTEAPPSATKLAPAPVVEVAEDVDADVAEHTDEAEPDQAAEKADTEPAAARITEGNKFEPNQTGPKAATTVGGQKHSGSTPIGSTLGKIVKGIKKALTHE